jgi:hypothetical protein
MRVTRPTHLIARIFGKLLKKFSDFQDTRIFMMMIMTACSWPKKPVVPYKRYKQGLTKATLKALLLERKTNHLCGFQIRWRETNSQYGDLSISCFNTFWTMTATDPLNKQSASEEICSQFIYLAAY